MKHEKLLDVLTTFGELPDTAGVPINVAETILNRSHASIWRDIAAGRLESFTIGRSRRIIVGSLRRACAARSVEAA